MKSLFLTVLTFILGLVAHAKNTLAQDKISVEVTDKGLCPILLMCSRGLM